MADLINDAETAALAAYSEQALRATLESAEYDHYGVRGIDSDAWLPSVGDIVPASGDWADGQPTGDMLDGTSAVSLADLTYDEALKRAGKYGDVVLVLGSDYASAGDDPYEIVMEDAVVLAIYRV